MEFSKKIFYMISFLLLIVSIFSMALMWKTNNTEALSWLIPSISGIAATVVGFYMWKAKAENLLKISKEIDLNKYKQIKNEIDELSDDDN